MLKVWYIYNSSFKSFMKPWHFIFLKLQMRLLAISLTMLRSQLLYSLNVLILYNFIMFFGELIEHLWGLLAKINENSLEHFHVQKSIGKLVFTVNNKKMKKNSKIMLSLRKIHSILMTPSDFFGLITQTTYFNFKKIWTLFLKITRQLIIWNTEETAGGDLYKILYLTSVSLINLL